MWGSCAATSEDTVINLFQQLFEASYILFLCFLKRMLSDFHKLRVLTFCKKTREPTKDASVTKTTRGCRVVPISGRFRFGIKPVIGELSGVLDKIFLFSFCFVLFARQNQDRKTQGARTADALNQSPQNIYSLLECKNATTRSSRNVSHPFLFALTCGR